MVTKRIAECIDSLSFERIPGAAVMCPVLSLAAETQIVEIKIKSGGRLVNRYDYTPESFHDVATQEHLNEKYRIYAGLALPEAAIEASLDALVT